MSTETDVPSPFQQIDRSLTKVIGIGVYRVVLLLVVIAQLWLTSKFVSVSDFKIVQNDVAAIKTTLAIMAAQDGKLQDHEERLRRMEESLIRLQGSR